MILSVYSLTQCENILSVLDSCHDCLLALVCCWCYLSLFEFVLYTTWCNGFTNSRGWVYGVNDGFFVMRKVKVRWRREFGRICLVDMTLEYNVRRTNNHRRNNFEIVIGIRMKASVVSPVWIGSASGVLRHIRFCALILDFDEKYIWWWQFTKY